MAFLGYERYSVEGYNSGDFRNVATCEPYTADIQAKIPRDRNGQFKQQTIPVYKQSTDSLEEMVIHLYRNGVTTAEIADLIDKIYGHHYSKGTISNMTTNIQAEVEAKNLPAAPEQYAS
jgi:transposase-like protein